MSVLGDEIAAQPEAVRAFLTSQTAAARRIVEKLPPFSYAVIAARGSSDHAALYARYAWPQLAGIGMALAAPSLHTVYGVSPRLDGALVVGISQSGQSPDVVAVIEDARGQGRPTIAITNDAASPLARAADHVLVLGVSERSIAATKTYTTQLAAVALLGALWSRDPARLDDLERAPAAMAATLGAAAPVAALLGARLATAGALFPVARGTNLCTAHEMALKVREIVGLHTHGFSAADFRHGSIAMATPGTPLVLIAPRGPAAGDMHALAEELRARGADIVVLAEEAPATTGATWLPIGGDLPEWLSPLVAILPGQLLAVAIAEARGIDPDQPRGLFAKVVRTL